MAAAAAQQQQIAGGEPLPALGGAAVPIDWARDTVWPRPANVAQPAPGQAVEDAPNVLVTGFSDLPVYDLRNGDVTEMVNWIVRATIPSALKWCPVAGLSSDDALRGAFGYMKTYHMLLTLERPDNIEAGQIHRAAVALGAARAVIQAMFAIGPADLVPGETVAPVLEAIHAANGAITFRSLLRRPMVANPQYIAAIPAGEGQPAVPAVGEAQIPDPAWVDAFVAPFELNDEDRSMMAVVARSAQTIIPIQGYNLIQEHHHYISAKGSAGMRAFGAVEAQLWKTASGDAKTLLQTEKEFYQDLLWHKAGHPVAIIIKLTAATSQSMADKLTALGIGSSSCRLPAIEPEVRALDTYAKVCSNVKTLWDEAEVNFNTAAFAAAKNTILAFPYGLAAEEVVISSTLTITSRQEAIRFAQGVIAQNDGLMGTLYGFYAAMMEDTEADSSNRAAQTLLKARSLLKLAGDNAANYANGRELYKDWKAARAKKRSEGVFKPMPVVATVPRSI